MAMRGSVAAAQSEVLPRREWPMTIMRRVSISGMVSMQSMARLMPHAHAPTAFMRTESGIVLPS